MKHCEFCGNRLHNNEQCTCVESQTKRNKTTKLQKLLIYIGFPVGLVLFVLIVLLCSEKIDPFDYVSVTFEGYNTNGEAIVDFDKRALISELIGEAPSELDIKARLAWEGKYAACSDDIRIDYPTDMVLSNNKTFSVSITVVNDTAKKIKGYTKSYTVSGLVEIDLVNVFENVTYTFNGMNGDGRLSVVSKDASDEFMNALQFSVEGDTKNGNLSNGSNIIVAVFL